MDLIQEMFCGPQSSWTLYNILNISVNVVVAFGTVWVCIIALPKKEKLEGKYNICLDNSDRDSFNIKISLEIINKSSVDSTITGVLASYKNKKFTAKRINDENAKYIYSFSGKNPLSFSIRCTKSSGKYNELKELISLENFDEANFFICTLKNNHFELKYDKNLE